MKKIYQAVILLSTIVTKSQAQEFLYKRLGVYDAIAAITDDFIVRLTTNKDLSRFFVAQGDDSKKKIRQHIVDFLLQCNWWSLGLYWPYDERFA